MQSSRCTPHNYWPMHTDLGMSIQVLHCCSARLVTSEFVKQLLLAVEPTAKPLACLSLPNYLCGINPPPNHQIGLPTTLPGYLCGISHVPHYRLTEVPQVQSVLQCDYSEPTLTMNLQGRGVRPIWQLFVAVWVGPFCQVDFWTSDLDLVYALGNDKMICRDVWTWPRLHF